MTKAILTIFSFSIASAGYAANVDSAKGDSRVIAHIGATPQFKDQIDPTTVTFRPNPALVALGRQVFFDPNLSEPRGTSCAGCHDPARAFSPTLNAQSRLVGTTQGSRPGHLSDRNAPSLLYVRYVPQRYFFQDDDDPYPSPFGGLFTDGRANDLAEQIRGPLFDANEMNNASPRSLLLKVKHTPIGQALSARFGQSVLNSPNLLVQRLGEVLAAYQQSDEMAPFSSRFDDYLRKRKPLTVQEMQGLAVFKNPDKGNCQSCHLLNDTSNRPERSLFTDFGYDAIAVPRNRALVANKNPQHFDNGLCKTAAQLHWPDPKQWCGYFRTPTLRNVAVRQSFMHNGVFKTLREAVAFYATRSTDPKHWYHGQQYFDDVPKAYRANININSTPLNRKVGLKPALSDTDIDDLVVFLRTLTDARYVSKMPSLKDQLVITP
ncbi:cytochrome-c peroxidase [Aquirhabdus parva]|uniref:Cytochrome-c methylamine utilization protein n=1 Tax=Aquirhabdus parva TaxID=2283318 RepID=A0A345PBA1_9GAMM|nr:cytochrome c peroxidase [Aquirhabdus parva]AXI04560.1 cytochrome-c methylamine utilization protein [Aquirhabdus parva]